MMKRDSGKLDDFGTTVDDRGFRAVSPYLKGVESKSEIKTRKKYLGKELDPF